MFELLDSLLQRLIRSNLFVESVEQLPLLLDHPLELLLQFIDEDPFLGPPHDRFALDGWEGTVSFDNVTVYPLNPTGS